MTNIEGIPSLARPHQSLECPQKCRIFYMLNVKYRRCFHIIYLSALVFYCLSDRASQEVSTEKKSCSLVFEIQQHLAKPMYPWHDLELLPFNVINSMCSHKCVVILFISDGHHQLSINLYYLKILKNFNVLKMAYALIWGIFVAMETQFIQFRYF